jgi:SAM-dependent MidA family methyltransferase
MPGYRELSTLPPLDSEQRAHAARVAARLRERIAAGDGWLGFADFMQIALYDAGLGYYSAGATKLGAEGDFITAPESSELFGRCVAVQVAEILRALPGDPADILEIGVGSGRLACTLLEELATLDALPGRYRILEVSADLRDRARARLARLAPELAARIEWLDGWPSAPLRGVVLANEVLDALPCERFVWRGGEVHELGVALAPDGQLVEAERRAGPPLERAVQAIRASLTEALPENYRSEVCLRLPAWIAAVSAALAAGAALFFDYGLPRAQLYLPERTDGTLIVHFRHRAHGDPLRHPGLEDISAWVDFTAVAEAALAAGLEVAGFATQAGFLLGLGIEARVAASTPGRERLRVAGEARRLLLPGEMGEAFKAIALTRGLDADLAGFRLQDLRASL